MKVRDLIIYVLFLFTFFFRKKCAKTAEEVLNGRKENYLASNLETKDRQRKEIPFFFPRESEGRRKSPLAMLSNISGYDYGLATLSLMVPAFLSAHCAWFHRQRSLEAHAMAARGLGVLPAGLALTAAFITSDVITGKWKEEIATFCMTCVKEEEEQKSLFSTRWHQRYSLLRQHVSPIIPGTLRERHYIPTSRV